MFLNAEDLHVKGVLQCRAAAAGAIAARASGMLNCRNGGIWYGDAPAGAARVD